MAAYYPPTDFYFQLQFVGIDTAPDNAFQEASGLTVELETEEVREGGQNLFQHRLPTAAKYGNLVLKRGFLRNDSALATWCTASIASDLSTPILPRDVQLSLLNSSGVVASWRFWQAWPVKWSILEFKPQDNGLAIETLELAYSVFERI